MSNVNTTERREQRRADSATPSVRLIGFQFTTLITAIAAPLNGYLR
jgi:hypothetical protein